MNFRDALTSTYCDNPCQVLPNAIWKTLTQLENLETTIGVENNAVNYLKAWDEKNLWVYWTRDREPAADYNQQPIGLQLALIHQDYLHTALSAGFAIQSPYFRLIHRQNKPVVRTPLPIGFSIMDVDIDVNIQRDAQRVSDLIGRCYRDIHPTVEAVTRWTEHPVFEPTLWIWVIDDATGVPIGLGIAEIDQTILEGSLEWIQVLPEYRGKGIGKCIVQELLSRLEKWVKFTTVAGEVDNATNPEALYRSCGFTGSDIWWVHRSF
jgi:GNAT superfamily N-acetyltransferase